MEHVIIAERKDAVSGITGASRKRIPSSPRAAAVQIIGFLRRGFPLSDAVSRSDIFRALDRGPQIVAWMIVQHSIAETATIRAILGACVLRPIPSRKATVEDILVCGTAELLAGRLSPALIVASCVSYTKDLGFESMSGLVNAVLRRVASDLAMKRAA